MIWTTDSKRKKNQGELIEQHQAERPVVGLQILCWETPRKCHLAASIPSFWCSSGNLSRVIVTCDPSCVLLAKCLQKERKDVADTQNSQLKRRLIIGSFSIDDGDGSENVTLKRFSRFFKRCRVYSHSAENVKCRRSSLQLISWGPHSSLERERKIRCRLFTSSKKREIRHFHVVVVQWRQRNVQKSVMHVQNCCLA